MGRVANSRLARTWSQQVLGGSSSAAPVGGSGAGTGMAGSGQASDMLLVGVATVASGRSFRGILAPRGGRQAGPQSARESGLGMPLQHWNAVGLGPHCRNRSSSHTLDGSKGQVPVRLTYLRARRDRRSRMLAKCPRAGCRSDTPTRPGLDVLVDATRPRPMSRSVRICPGLSGGMFTYEWPAPVRSLSAFVRSCPPSRPRLTASVHGHSSILKAPPSAGIPISRSVPSIRNRYVPTGNPHITERPSSSRTPNIASLMSLSKREL